MLRAMDSAVSGLRAHQNKLDVIGHNIANVNTVGYKSQSYTFKDTMYQSATASTNGGENSGGVNAAQYGYGSLMGTISIDMSASTPTYVGGFSATIDGNGFFVTKATREGISVPTNGVAANDTDAIKRADFDYTRVGQFKVDSNGYIVDGNGNFVFGYQNISANDSDPANGTYNPANGKAMVALRIPQCVPGMSPAPNGVNIDLNYPVYAADSNPDNALECTSIKINKAGNIEATLTYPAVDDQGNAITKSGVFTIGTVAIVTFQNQEGLTKDGSNYYKASESDNTGLCSADVPGSNRASLMPGYLEASNVDMAVEFSEMIMAERGFQANSKLITVSDEILSDLINMKR